MFDTAQIAARERRINVLSNQAFTFAYLDLGSHHRRFKMIRKLTASLLAAIFVAGLLGSLAGCNTMAGAGQDIQQGGKALKDEANEQKRY